MSAIGAAVRGDMSRCRACRATILWVRMPSGKLMPCNPVPDDEGNVAAMRDARGVWVGHVLRKAERTAPYEKRLMPHVATCVPVITARAEAIAAGTVVDLHTRAGRPRR